MKFIKRAISQFHKFHSFIPIELIYQFHKFHSLIPIELIFLSMCFYFLSVFFFFFFFFLALLAIAQRFVNYKLILFVCKHTNSNSPDTVLFLYNFISFPLFLY